MSKSQAAVILPAAVLELFPNVQLMGGGPTSWGFYSDFDFSTPFQTHFLQLIEDRMRLILKGVDGVQITEMVQANASELLRHHGQKQRAKQALASQNPLVKVAQCGKFFDLCNFPISKEPSHFKLLEAIGEKTIRIVGVACPTKEALKAFVKSWTSIRGRTHQELVQELKFAEMASQGWIWLSKGELVRQKLLEVWKAFFLSQKFELIATPSSTLVEMVRNHAKIGKKSAAISLVSCEFGSEGMLTPAKGFVDQAYFFGNATEFIISFLQFIVKFLRMFPFDYEVVLCGKKSQPLQKALKECHIEAVIEKEGESGVEFRIRDVWGRNWTGPYVKAEEGVAIFSLFSSMERFFALLLEATHGALPFWIAPEQIRILSLGGTSGDELQSKLIREGWRVVLDDRKDPLKQRIRDALQERVPYSIVLGEREHQTGMLSVRAYGSDELVEMKLETLISRLKQFENQ